MQLPPVGIAAVVHVSAAMAKSPDAAARDGDVATVCGSSVEFQNVTVLGELIVATDRPGRPSGGR